MKKAILLILAFVITSIVNAQVTELSNGNVGIGTTSPLGKVDILSATDQVVLRLSMPTNEDAAAYDIKWANSNADVVHRIQYANAYYDFMNVNRATRNVSFNGGKFGIGTTTPSSMLEVKSSLSSPATYEVQKWTNSHHSGYNLGLKTIWDINGINHSFVQKFNGTDYNSLSFYAGRVGIGTTKPDMKLTVKGNIHAEEVKIDLNVPVPDYVFKDNYNLRSIEQVEKYIIENSHLPEIPSAKEFEQNGLMLAEMNMNLLKKIEELTLYTIQQQKEIKELKLLNKKFLELQSRLQKLESKK